MSLKKVYADKMVDAPFNVRGGCLPYAIAAVLNNEKLIHECPDKDENGKPLSYDFHHASLMYSSTIREFAYFDVILARSRTYNAKGELKQPKNLIQFEEFSHSVIVFHISKIFQDKDSSKFVFLFETAFRKKTHAIGVVLDVGTGMAIVCDVQKKKTVHVKIWKVFKMYRVLRVAVLKYEHNQVPAYTDEFFMHLIDNPDGRSTDTETKEQ